MFSLLDSGKFVCAFSEWWENYISKLLFLYQELNMYFNRRNVDFFVCFSIPTLKSPEKFSQIVKPKRFVIRLLLFAATQETWKGFQRLVIQVSFCRNQMEQIKPFRKHNVPFPTSFPVFSILCKPANNFYVTFLVLSLFAKFEIFCYL